MSEQKGKMSFARIYQRFGVVILLAIVFVAACFATPNFLTPKNLTNVMRQITVITTVGCGLCFVLISANFNIAYDGLIALIGCLSCIVMYRRGCPLRSGSRSDSSI